jgi:hypothetical protein
MWARLGPGRPPRTKPGKFSRAAIDETERDVGAAEVNAAARNQVGRVADLVEKVADAGAVEKCQIAETVELLQADDLLVEGLRAVGVADGQSDLADVD